MSPVEIRGSILARYSSPHANHSSRNFLRVPGIRRETTRPPGNRKNGNTLRRSAGPPMSTDLLLIDDSVTDLRLLMDLATARRLRVSVAFDGMKGLQ